MIELLVTRLENGKNTKSNLFIPVDDNCKDYGLRIYGNNRIDA